MIKKRLPLCCIALTLLTTLLFAGFNVAEADLTTMQRRKNLKLPRLLFPTVVFCKFRKRL